MAEIFEIEESPATQATSASDKNSSEKAEKPQSSSIPLHDKHIPSFDFNAYPLAPADNEAFSPRISDETWQRFEKQSNDEAGAT